MFNDIYNGRRVLVTGHTGFKGSWLSFWLADLGAKVAGYALDPAGERSNFEAAGLHSFLDRDERGDVRDLDHLRAVVEEYKPEIIFHLAAQPLVHLSYKEPVYTFDTNVRGTANILEAVRLSGRACSVVMITSDKCYENREMDYAYRETDPMGGHDPYSASKGCAELVSAAYRASYFAPGGKVRLATARAGNVIGPGDWAADRIVPDAVRALSEGRPLFVRNAQAVRPWQHVLEPLSGYLLLGQLLTEGAAVAESWNFGPSTLSKHTVGELADLFCREWGDGASWQTEPPPSGLHEAHLLQLSIEKAAQRLDWHPRWDFETTIRRTAHGYKRLLGAKGAAEARDFLHEEIQAYTEK